MYPDLSYFLHDLFNVPADNVFSIVKTFGLFLVTAILASHYFFAKELKRKYELGLLKSSTETIVEGEGPSIYALLLNAALGFFMGYKLVYLLFHFKELGNDLFAFLISSQGNGIAGILAAIFFGFSYWWPKQKQKKDKVVSKKVTILPYQRSADIAIRAGISGILGAKLFAVFESVENIKAFFSDPIGQFFSGSGLTVYGGFIVGFAYLTWYVNRKNMKPIHVMDSAAPAMMMGYAVGRIGCHLSGDGDWGIVNTQASPSWWLLPDWLWAYDYPRNVLKDGVLMDNCQMEYCYRLANPVFPTPVYEIIVCLGLFAILWYLRKKISTPGMLLFIFIIFNGIERFFIEKIRVNDKIPLLGMELTQAEIISFLLIIVGIVGVIWLSLNKSKKNPEQLQE